MPLVLLWFRAFGHIWRCSGLNESRPERNMACLPPPLPDLLVQLEEPRSSPNPCRSDALVIRWFITQLRAQNWWKAWTRSARSRSRNNRGAWTVTLVRGT